MLVVTGFKAMWDAPRRTEEPDFRRAGTGIVLKKLGFDG